jgi:CHAD domain-containing protein
VTAERETKLSAPAGFRMPDLTADGFVATVREPQRLVTNYLDTADLRIARWGCSLRRRQAERKDVTWTVKLPGSEEGSLLVRSEHDFEGGDPRRPPAEAMDLLTAYVRGAPLAPVARLRTVRRGVELADELGRPVATVTDDEVSVMDGARVASRFRELEVELAPGVAAATADAIVERLTEGGAGPVENVPKLRRALGPHAAEPPEVTVDEVQRDSTVADVVRRAIAGSVEALLRHDAGVRLGDDPEDVHKARVATRRLRSDLRTFRDFVEPAWSGPLRDELRWLGGELGAVRDAEVLRDRLRSREALIAAADRRTLGRLLATLDRRRDVARDHALAAMRETRYVALLDRLVEAAREPGVLVEVAAARATTALLPALEAPWKHLKTAVGHLDDPTDATLHQARIRAKRMRYAAEAVAPAFGKRAETFARKAERLQDVLGEHQDAVVAAAWLRDAAGSGAQAFVAGQLVAIEEEAKRTARAAWPAAWSALSRKKLRFWA